MDSRDLPERQACQSQQALNALGRKWAALHEAANAIASMGGISAEPMAASTLPREMANAAFPLNRVAEPWIEDMTAMLEPGIVALLAAHERGANSQPAARALWQEFVNARDSLIDMAARQTALQLPPYARPD